MSAKTSPAKSANLGAYLSPLRRDLRSVCVPGRSRVERIIVDEIGGRFARVSDHVWQRLQQDDADADLWNEARSVGWTRHRDQNTRARFHPLAIRVPLGSIDWIAKRLARWSGAVFAPLAVVFWMMTITLTFLLVAVRADEVFASLGSLQTFLAQSSPLAILTVFVFTKLIHEVAHAVMCRRIGSRVGSFGILFLCGMPCPYCDVTDIWRQTSTVKRMSVMLAGIYVEWIVAALASMIWLVAFDPAIRLAALNVMIVCGVSTLVFNANPLMRYDGYYALTDLVSSTNLRRESRNMFAAVLISRLAGDQYGIARRSDRRALGLAGYHLAASVYRTMVAITIAALVVCVAEMLGAGSIAIVVILLMMFLIAARFTRRVLAILRGAGRWEHVPTVRRGFVVSMITVLVLTLLFTPLPRFRRASGIIDAAHARTVYFSSSGMVDSVWADFGDRVVEGQPLVQLSNDSLAIEEVSLSGQWNVASLRTRLSRRSDLEHPRNAASASYRSDRQVDPGPRFDSASQWPALQAAEEAIAARLASSRKRVSETKVHAEVSGMVIPLIAPHSHMAGQQQTASSLHDLQGRAVDMQIPWCRVSPDGKLYAVLKIDAQDRQMIDIGSPVKVFLTNAPQEIIATSVVSVSEIQPEDSTVIRQAVYQVLCPLPPEQDDRLLSLLAAQCQGVFPLPQKSLADQIVESIGNWISGSR